MFDSRPIYLPNQEIPGSFESRLPSAYAASIIIPELYKVRWVRGLDMFNIFYKDGYIKLYDENEEDIFLHNPPLPKNTPAFTTWLTRPNTKNRTPIQIMQEIEDKYPGLFISEYVKSSASQKGPPSPSRRRNPPSPPKTKGSTQHIEDRYPDLFGKSVFQMNPPPKTKKLSPQKGGMNKTKKC